MEKKCQRPEIEIDDGLLMSLAVPRIKKLKIVPHESNARIIAKYLQDIEGSHKNLRNIEKVLENSEYLDEIKCMVKDLVLRALKRIPKFRKEHIEVLNSKGERSVDVPISLPKIEEDEAESLLTIVNSISVLAKMLESVEEGELKSKIIAEQKRIKVSGEEVGDLSMIFENTRNKLEAITGINCDGNYRSINQLVGFPGETIQVKGVYKIEDTYFDSLAYLVWNKKICVFLLFVLVISLTQLIKDRITFVERSEEISREMDRVALENEQKKHTHLFHPIS